MLAPRELRIRYRQSVLDIAWALIGPVVTLAVYGIILTQSFDVSSACSPYLVSAWLGLVLWTFFASSVTLAVTSLIASANLVGKVYFPRESVPLAAVGSSSVELAIGAVTVLVLVVLSDVALTPMALAVILPLAVLIVWAAAVSIWLAVLATFARDLVHATHLAIRVGFFATPIMYEAAFLPAAFAWSEHWNPVAVSVTGARDAVLCGSSPDLMLLAVHLGVGAMLLVGAVLYTRSVESRIADVL
jgi:lipopolysaccharide transport system permease protein